MTDLIHIQMKKDNKYSEISANKKSLEQILSQKKNIMQAKKKIEKVNNNNYILNKNNNKNNTVEIINIILYGLLGFIILFHLFHFIFSKSVSN